MTPSRKTFVLLALAALVTATATAFVWLQRGPSASQFVHLKDPRISRMSDQRMLVVTARGDPSKVAGRAFKTLFAAYYRLGGVPKAARPPAPRARWRVTLDTPRSEWQGEYALPVAVGAALPANVAAPPDMQVAITTWPYGDVAELLHVGPYSREQPNIARLHDFIESNGYGIVGEHEEEYVKGPGMFFAGDPDAYLTIIRLRIARARPVE